MENKKKKSGSIGGFVKKYMTDVSSGGVKYSTVKTGEKKKFPIYIAAFALLITAMLMFIVFSFVQVAQLRADINKMDSEISKVEKEINSRTRDIEAKYKDTDFEARAREMGMTDSKYMQYLPRDKEENVSTVVYGGDKGKNSGSLLSVIGRGFSKLIEFIN